MRGMRAATSRTVRLGISVTTEASLHKIEEYWTSTLGIEPGVLGRAGVTVVRHGPRLDTYRGAYLLLRPVGRGAALVISVPPGLFDYVRAVVQRATPAEVFAPPFLESLFGPAIERIMGTIWLAYADQSDLRGVETRGARLLAEQGRYTVPIGEARVVRAGGQVTVIAWSAMVAASLAAAETLAGEGIDCEVIDLRTLAPFDADTIVASVEKTGRAVVVHEAPRTAGLGAEIVATINDRALLSLEAPVMRVTGYDVPIPPAALEDCYAPTPARIAEAMRAVISF